ncbi:RNA polymerase sigma factor [Micromonospora ureilytica]|uniref:RNA polymerase sigma factor n=1 Tax=Micromonospora ureilytica TaxID=709868 RepID=UPI0033D4B175
MSEQMEAAKTQRGLEDFAAYYRDDFTRLIRFLIRKGASFSEAEDVAQEAMECALLKWPTIEHPPAWVRRTASFIFIRIRRKSRRERVWWLRNGPQDDATEQIFDIEAQHFHRMVKELPTKQRDVMAWTAEGYTPTEIASVTGQDPGTVRSHLRHARRALIRKLDQQRSDGARREASDGPRQGP